jgi:hypothetical protein
MRADEARALSNTVRGDAPTLDCVEYLKAIKEAASRGETRLRIPEGLRQNEIDFFTALGYTVFPREYVTYKNILGGSHIHRKTECRIEW